MARTYEKLYTSETLVINPELALVTEVTKGTNQNTFSFWLKYKHAGGTWEHTGTTTGPKNIRLPMSMPVLLYLQEEVVKLIAIQKKVDEAGLTITKPDAKATTKAGLPDLDNPELFKAFMAFMATEAKKGRKSK